VIAPRALFPIVLAGSFVAGAFGPSAARRTPAAPAPSPASAQLFSPGPLTRDHAELEGDDKCGRCHASGRGISVRGCLECHDDVRATIRRRQGLHGGRYRGKDCGECHVEHLGRGAPLIRWPGGSRDAFDHALTGYRLDGAHRRIDDCLECHDERNRRGRRTFLGLETACASCHRDPHDGRLGNDCGGCHETSSFDRVDLDGFDHGRARFPLRGAHRQVDCVGCHGTPARYQGLAFGSCASCHDDPHRGRFGADDCARCHVETGWDDVDGIARFHPGVPLRGGHRGVACGRCHDRGNIRAPSRGSACVACHQVVHEADLGRNCRDCHGSIRWLGLPDRIGRRIHDRTPFPLEGAHQEAACEGCHRPALPRSERYRGLAFDACTACHRNPHPDDGLLEMAPGGDCAGCHEVQGFAPTTFGVAAHGATAFPLEGRHRAVPCAGCHGTERPRLDLSVSVADCVDCHANPHGDQFAREMATDGCAGCHSPRSWHQPNIDHDTWPLTGAHAEAACSQCHRASPEDRRAGRGASFRGVPRSCAGCHEDPHAGQFRLSAPLKGCADCHETNRFAPLPDFDHAARTGWALEGRHADAPCAACHQVARLRNGLEAVRYRLGYRDCGDCHGNPHRAPGPGTSEEEGRR